MSCCGGWPGWEDAVGCTVEMRHEACSWNKVDRACSETGSSINTRFATKVEEVCRGYYCLPSLLAR